MPEMGHGAIVDLARTLLAKTKNDELECVQVENETTSYEARLPSGIVRVRSIDRDGRLPAQLVVYGPQGGEALDSITSPTAGIFGEGDVAVGSLYEAVRRRVLGVDSVIAGLLDDLREAPRQPPEDDDIPF